jgi:hypothetical protein
VWVDDDGVVHVSVATADGGRAEQTDALKPFAWLGGQTIVAPAGITVEELRGEAPFARLARADTLAGYEAFLKTAREAGGVDAVRPLENQYLIQQRSRLYRELGFAQLRRCQLDIETSSADGSFSDAAKPEDRVLAIGLRAAGQNRLLLLAEATDAAEKQLLQELNAALAELDPDVIEGHNIFKFDLDFLRQRAKRHKVPCAWGRFGQKATFRNSRLKVAERWIDFPRCDLPGRTVVDTYLLVQLYDITTRELTAYGLKDVAVYFGITDEDSEDRTYLDGGKIAETFWSDRARFCAYLEDDLRETQGLADLLTLQERFGGLSGLMAMAGVVGAMGDRETESERERTYKDGKRVIHESEKKNGGRAEYKVVLGNGVMVSAEAQDMDLATLKRAVGRIDLNALEKAPG